MLELHSSFLNYRAEEENYNKDKSPRYPHWCVAFYSSGSGLEAVGFVIVFVQVVTDRNEIKLQFHEIQASAHNSFVAAILFHDAEGTFCLDGSVHSQQGSVSALQVIQNLPVHRSQFLVQPNRAIAVGLFTLFCVGTATAILAFIDFFLSTIQVPFDRSAER